MKKFLCFFSATIILALLVLLMFVKYIVPSDYPVFVQSFDHGVMTVSNLDATGTDNKFKFFAKRGQKVTININPERNDKAYYDLSKLIINGEDMTDRVKMLEYTFHVDEKTTILAYFKKSKTVSPSTTGGQASSISAPDIFDYAKNPYFGSANAYDIRDPSIFYDKNSGEYYCFASNNIVMHSRDLVNWEGRTNYFKIPETSDTKSIMSFSRFASVKSWAKEHGYSRDESISTLSNNRAPSAPDIVEVDGTYYLYFSLSKEANANESAIFVVKTNDLKEAISSKEWEDVGLVISTCGHNSTSGESFNYDKTNAVHPSVVLSKGNSKMYMTYGGYFGREVINGSVNILELSTETGLLKKGSSINSMGDEVSTLHGKKRFNSGVIVANPGKIPALTKNDGSLISATDIVYSEYNGYYYLFMTYGVANSNYEIRVARSKDPAGPYLDIKGNDVSSFGKSASSNRYKKGTMLASGYNFIMSSGGGVSYVDIGRASIGSPSVIKSQSGDWIMASQSNGYYKFDGMIYCGDAVANENELNVETASALEIRKVFFKNEWPLAMPETYCNEKLGEEFSKTDLYGHWDMIVFDGTSPSEDYDSVSRYVSKKVTLFNNAAITETAISKKSKLVNNSFHKESAQKYTIVLDGVKYTVYPTTVWDNELDCETIVVCGFGEDGTVLWGKKGFNSYTGIYLDVFEYLLENTDYETSEKYTKRLNNMKNNPNREKIDEYSLNLVKKILSNQSK